MSKYSSEFKLKVVKYYLTEHHSYLECQQKIKIIEQCHDNHEIYSGVMLSVTECISIINNNITEKFVERLLEK